MKYIIAPCKLNHAIILTAFDFLIFFLSAVPQYQYQQLLNSLLSPPGQISRLPYHYILLSTLVVQTARKKIPAALLWDPNPGNQLIFTNKVHMNSYVFLCHDLKKSSLGWRGNLVSWLIGIREHKDTECHLLLSRWWGQPQQLS